MKIAGKSEIWIVKRKMQITKWRVFWKIYQRISEVMHQWNGQSDKHHIRYDEEQVARNIERMPTVRCKWFKREPCSR